MAKSKIEWLNGGKVWNPITGCSKVSEGCRNCYALRMSKRLAGRYGYPADDSFRMTLHPEKLEEPLKWKKPQKIFICSMSDWMQDEIPDEFIDRMLEVMDTCPQHVFLTLTKRPENLYQKLWWPSEGAPCRFLCGGDYLPNLLLGVSVENQETVDERIPILLQVPAAKRFVSVEPMLEEIQLDNYLYTRFNMGGARDMWNQLDWVIVGAETGPKARLMNLDWARLLREQCRMAGENFFFY